MSGTAPATPPAVVDPNVTPVAADLRTMFPAFADPVRYPDAMLTLLIGVASNFLDPARWGELLAYGIYLWVAHNLAMETLAEAGGPAAAPGIAGGIIASKTIGPLAKSYNTDIGTVDGAGNFNMTTYGVRFYQLRNLVGAGVIQLGGFNLSPTQSIANVSPVPFGNF